MRSPAQHLEHLPGLSLVLWFAKYLLVNDNHGIGRDEDIVIVKVCDVGLRLLAGDELGYVFRTKRVGENLADTGLGDDIELDAHVAQQLLTPWRAAGKHNMSV